ncbi:MAG: TIGR02680 family protein [Sciscionella sp.]
MSTSAQDRWRLHRGGIVNVWQYQVEEFDLSGGRAIFQGTNGSGKSRTLELLLPLCLDGDLRQMGSKGFDTVSMRRLMLDEYTGGPNRIGYAWVELRRNSGDAAREEFLTCGVGVKASANSQQISDSWRFITQRRLGADFSLIAEEAPLGSGQLRELLGGDCLYEEQPYRAKIADVVYGMPAGRYGDLLHLQRTLRNPDVGLKVLEGQLEQILSDALPPLDASMIEQLAGSFEDLESIRENIGRLATADTALRGFLSSYSGYALAALRAAGNRSMAAADALRSARGEIRSLVDRLQKARRDSERAETEVSTLDARNDALESKIGAVKESPAYQGIRELADRKRLIATKRDTAIAALENATAGRTHADRAVDSVLSVMRRLGTDTAAAQELAATTADKLAEAGLDAALCPAVPTVPTAEPGETSYRVRAKPDPESEPLRITRRTPPELNAGTLRAALAEAAESVRHAVTLAHERSALTLSLHERAKRSDAERAKIDRLREQARGAQLAATEATGRRNETAQRLEDAAYTWRDAVLRWAGSGPLLDIGDTAAELLPPDIAALTDDVDVARAAGARATEWTGSRLPSLRARVSAVARDEESVTERITEAEAALTALRRGEEPEPPPPAFATAYRDPSAGSSFYRLVDFAAHLGARDRAGIEVALQCSGLLTAWVTTDGSLGDPDLADLLAVPDGEPAVGRTLAEALVPAIPPDSPIPVETVAKLLARVSLAGTGASDALAVSTSGRWRAGVLAGAASKPEPEFVGAGAREATRQHRIAAFTAELRESHARREELRAELAEASRRVAEWERHAQDYPDDRTVLTAHLNLRHARDAAAEATELARELRDKHSTAADRHQAAHGELVSDAHTAGLDPQTESLAHARTAAGDARSAAEKLREALAYRCDGTVTDLVEMLGNHALSEDELTEAERAADARCAEYAEEAAGYDELEGAIGGEAAALEGQLAQMEAERRHTRQALPSAREAATAHSNQVVKTQTLLDTKEFEAGKLVEADTVARQGFRAALHARGVWAAAIGEQVLPQDSDDAAELLTAAEQRPASEDTVIGKLQALQTTLAGSHDVTAERDAGILTVTITGQDGPRPVAQAAHEVAELLAEQRGILSEQYQQIFATFMLRNLAEQLSAQVAVAEDLCRRMNEILDVARSSQGVHVRLDWQPSPALDDATRQALHLLRTPFAKRTDAQDEQLRLAFTERIAAERDSFSGGYAEILGRALDYRDWYQFTVRVRDIGPDAAPRTRRMRQLSSGETRLISYVTLFAAAAAFYAAVSGSGGTPPLRLVLLDEAFERLDDPTVARMLGLLVDLDMDWIITWPSGWGVSEKIPRMHIYDVLRPKSGGGIACTHTTWDGTVLDRAES